MLRALYRHVAETLIKDWAAKFNFVTIRLQYSLLIISLLQRSLISLAVRRDLETQGSRSDTAGLCVSGLRRIKLARWNKPIDSLIMGPTLELFFWSIASLSPCDKRNSSLIKLKKCSIRFVTLPEPISMYSFPSWCTVIL